MQDWKHHSVESTLLCMSQPLILTEDVVIAVTEELVTADHEQMSSQ